MIPIFSNLLAEKPSLVYHTIYKMCVETIIRPVRRKLRVLSFL